MFWENTHTRNLSDQGKLLALYLLTGPHSNMLGSFRIPNGYISEDLNWDVSIVKSALEQLIQINFISRDEESAWLIIYDFLKWNPIQNPRQGVGVQKLFDSIPNNSTIFKPLIHCLLDDGKYLNKEFVNRLHTVSGKCVADQEQDQDQKQNQEQDIYTPDESDDIYKDFIFEEQEALAHPNPEPTLKSQAIEVLEFLNQKTGKSYRLNDNNLRPIIERLKSGVTVIDCHQVIANKVRQWKDNEKMKHLLNLGALFNANKLEQYLGELPSLDDEAEDHAHSLS